jgi:hypothetical protein
MRNFRTIDSNDGYDHYLKHDQNKISTIINTIVIFIFIGFFKCSVC